MALTAGIAALALGSQYGSTSTVSVGLSAATAGISKISSPSVRRQVIPELRLILLIIFLGVRHPIDFTWPVRIALLFCVYCNEILTVSFPFDFFNFAASFASLRSFLILI